MKKKIFNIIGTIFAFAALFTLASCGGISDSEDKTDEKAVLRVELFQNTRTVVPDSDFSTFAFELKSGEITLGSCNGSAALADTVFDLSGNGISVDEEATFTLTASKDGVTWQGSSTATVKAGENIVEYKTRGADGFDEMDADKAIETAVSYIMKELTI